MHGSPILFNLNAFSMLKFCLFSAMKIFLKIACIGRVKGVSGMVSSIGSSSKIGQQKLPKDKGLEHSLNRSRSNPYMHLIAWTCRHLILCRQKYTWALLVLGFFCWLPLRRTAYTCCKFPQNPSLNQDRLPNMTYENRKNFQALLKGKVGYFKLRTQNRSWALYVLRMLLLHLEDCG